MKGTDSQRKHRAQRAQARRYRTKVTEWLNSGQAGSPPQPKVWFPELPAILTQAGLLPQPPVNFYMPLAELSDKDNRYNARLAENRARYAGEALAAGQPYRPGNVITAEITPGDMPTGEPVDLDEADIEYEMNRVRIHAANIRRERRGEPLLPVPPPRLKPGSIEWWQASALADKMPTVERCREAAFRLALRGDIDLQAVPEEFQLKLAAWVGKQE